MKESEMRTYACPYTATSCRGNACMACKKYEIISTKEQKTEYYCAMIYQEQVFESVAIPPESPQIPEGYTIKEIKND